MPNAFDHGVAYSSIADGPNEPREGPIISVEGLGETGEDESETNQKGAHMNADERRQSHLLGGMAMPAINEDLSIMEASMMDVSMMHSSGKSNFSPKFSPPVRKDLRDMRYHSEVQQVESTEQQRFPPNNLLAALNNPAL